MAVARHLKSIVPFALLVFPAFAEDAKLSAKDAGIRYGQALGAVELCYGSKLTPKGEALAKAYEGQDLEVFKAAAAETFQSWAKAKGCINPTDPNQCKIIMDKSCLNAIGEIGPEGKAAPGLVEFLKWEPKQ